MRIANRRFIVPALMFVVALAVASCVQIPRGAEEIEAEKFQVVPGKAVIYLVRPWWSSGFYSSTVVLDDAMMGATHSGTYFRWEVPPGRHRIGGFAADVGHLMIDTAPGGVYYVQQTTIGTRSLTSSHFQQVPQADGRSLVAGSRWSGTHAR